MPRTKHTASRKRKVTERLDELIRNIMLPEVMGLDDCHLGGIQDEPHRGRIYRAVMTKLDCPKRFVGLFHTRRIGYLQRVLGDIPIEERMKVRVFCIDMWRPFRLLAQRVFPLALIIIDVFHIVSQANDCLDAVRISVQKQIVPGAVRAARNRGIGDKKALNKIRQKAHKKQLYLAKSSKVLAKRGKELDPGEREKCQRLCDGEPDLKTAYDLKERFCSIWDEAQSPEQARAMYQIWEDSIPPQQLRFWKPVITAVANWSTEIFNYFVEPDPEKRTTNDFTERMVGKIKKINRAGNGCCLATIWLKLERQDELTDRREALRKAEQEQRLSVPAVVLIPDAQSSIQSSLRMANRIAKRKRALNRRRGVQPVAVIGQGSLFPTQSDGATDASNDGVVLGNETHHPEQTTSSGGPNVEPHGTKPGQG